MLAGSDWFRVHVPRPNARLQLICFPYAGGSASVFREWGDMLPLVELISVQYPGRQDRVGDPFAVTLAELADRLAEKIQPLLCRRTAFFGHSMGAIVAFEVARRLRPRFPSPLTRLFVSACNPPAEARPRGLSFDDTELRDYVRELGGADATTSTEDDELWQLALPPLRADLRLTETYRYVRGAPLACPITAIAGDEDAFATIEEMRRWREHSVAGTDIRALPGGHFYFDDSLPELAKLLQSELDTGRTSTVRSPG
ncbi:thioesterase [Amycolatopsis sp. WAC 04169]|uniref:thioesterase II family protein n=1 Tax=Amycolatopsis sp. WAC 04169 TaxID=2203197 RepID=UPI000F78F04D|nr:alpha/beta fold hydrolase [Amycolatopsis sp. WAC 04169]RSN29148.1 thioesterase [Amycolatopsis sp. WAC 04169]